VTALIAWPSFIFEMEPRSINRWQHRLKREHLTCTERNKALIEECGWKGGDSAAKKQRDQQNSKTNPHDSDRPSHGRRLHQQPEFNGDLAVGNRY
jgi:hypothetical protein